MSTPTERELVAALNELAVGAPVRRLEAVLRLIAELVGGQHDGTRKGASDAVNGPDIVVTRGDRTPLTIEVKIGQSSSFRKSMNNRAADLLAAAIQQGRAVRGNATQAALLLLVGQSDDPQHEASIASFADRLLRGADGIGYDAVLVGTADDELHWQYFAAHQLYFPGSGARVSTREAFAALRDQESPRPRKLTPPASQRLRVLLVSDEWRSGRGGISTLNRELAAALATAGADPAVFVPEASEQDRRSASEAGVSLVAPALVPGLSDREAMLLRPVFSTRGWSPDIIVGHGRVLGAYAAAQQQEHFPEARRVHFIHTDAEQLEAAKETSGGDSRMVLIDERRSIERSLSSSADLVVGVGPLLTETIRDELLGTGTGTKVISLTPGLRNAFDLASAQMPVKNRVLLVGRADDFVSKGLDIAAEALLRVVDHWPHNKPHPPELVIRGVPEEFAKDVKCKLDGLFSGRVSYALRPYSDSEESLFSDFAQARVLIMPSRHEGFGLAAFEAIAAGLPVRISAQSGLAQFMHENHIDSSPSSVVTTRDSPTSLAVDLWVDSIREVLEDPAQARVGAIELRRAISKTVTWSASARALLDEMRAIEA